MSSSLHLRSEFNHVAKTMASPSAAEEWLEDDELGEDSTLGVASKKEHSFTAPGTSEILSVAEFKAVCAREDSHLNQLQTPVPSCSSDADKEISQQMGVTVDALQAIKEVCE